MTTESLTMTTETWTTKIRTGYSGTHALTITIYADGRVALPGTAPLPREQAAQEIRARHPGGADRRATGDPPRDVITIEQDLRDATLGLLAGIERRSRIVAEVVQETPGSPVYTAYVTYAETGRAVHRCADEGGTHYSREQASVEARDRALRAAGGDASRIEWRGVVQ